MTNKYGFTTNIHDFLITKKPSFCHQKLDLFEEWKYKEVCEEQHYYNASVPLNQVVGTYHPNYANQTWIDLLPARFKSEKNIPDFSEKNNFERMKNGEANAYEFCKNPKYYFSDEKKENWGFYKFGEKFYIEDGNHRTVIAKFFLNLNNLPEVVNGVSVTEFIPKKSSSFNLIEHFFKGKVNNS